MAASWKSCPVFEETPAPDDSYVQSIVISDVGANYVAVDGSGNLYVSDLSDGKVVCVSLAPSALTPIAPTQP
jgi:hypothetical protein